MQSRVLETPLVSVIIPTYNRADYVAETVESVLQQENTHHGHEVIVIDDGSTDDTRAALAPYESRICYQYQENAGPCAARNHGLRLAQGKFVLFLDSDDVLLPGALAGMLGCMADRSEIGAVQGGWSTIGPTGETLREIEPWCRTPQLDLDALVMTTPIFLGGLLCRKSWADRAGGFDPMLCQVGDVDFVLRLALLECQFTWLRRPVVQYRQHADNMTHNALEQAHESELVLGKLFERPELPERIRQKKDLVFYYRNAWFAWRLWRTGCEAEVEGYFRRSLACSPISPQQTVLQWAKLFANWSRDVGAGAEDLQALLPRMRAVVPLDAERWLDLERVLPWWAAVWAHYLEPGGVPPAQAWQFNERLSRDQLLALAQLSLLITPVYAMVWAIGGFAANAHNQPLEPPFHSYETVSLYLTAFGQAALARRPGVAARALGCALRHSLHPRVFAAWLRFAGNALRYSASDRRGTLGSGR